MKLKLLTALILCLFAIQGTFAHALWIETQSAGQLNKKHAIKVYYGEYAEQAIDSVAKWYSDVKDFELYVISPTGAKTKLEKQQQADHFTADFTPTEKGTYTISVIHAAKEAYETMRFEFSSIAFVNIGKSADAIDQLPFHLKSTTADPKAGANLELLVLDNGKALPDTEVIIMAPEGWTKTVHSDKDGKISIKPLSSGKYIIEASKTDDTKETWHEKAIEKTWKGTTLSLLIK